MEMDTSIVSLRTSHQSVKLPKSLKRYKVFRRLRIGPSAEERRREATMETLIGLWVTCSLTFLTENPDLKRPVPVTVERARCQVIDDRFMPVGTSELSRTPVLLDCSRDILMFKLTHGDRVFLVNKEDGYCQWPL